MVGFLNIETELISSASRTINFQKKYNRYTVLLPPIIIENFLENTNKKTVNIQLHKIRNSEENKKIIILEVEPE